MGENTMKQRPPPPPSSSLRAKMEEPKEKCWRIEVDENLKRRRPGDAFLPHQVILTLTRSASRSTFEPFSRDLIKTMRTSW